jgi:hypothetical protein
MYDRVKSEKIEYKYPESISKEKILEKASNYPKYDKEYFSQNSYE